MVRPIRITDTQRNLSYVWKGGHTVNVFDIEEKNVHAFSVGDFERRPEDVPRDEVRREIIRRLRVGPEG